MFILKPQIGLIIHLGECHIDLQRGIIDLYSLHIGLDLTVPTQKDPLPNLRLGRIRQKKRKPQSVHCPVYPLIIDSNHSMMESTHMEIILGENGIHQKVEC